MKTGTGGARRASVLLLAAGVALAAYGGVEVGQHLTAQSAVTPAPVAAPPPTQQPQSPPPDPSAAPTALPDAAVDPDVAAARELVGLPPQVPTPPPSGTVDSEWQAARAAMGLAPLAPLPPDTVSAPDHTTQLSHSAPRPVALTVPDIGVSQGLIDLGINPDGTLEVPQDYQAVGWYAGGYAPGEPGPAVMVGHVDSFEGPAVFYEVSRLEPGARIEVARDDGSVVAFVVDRVESYNKTEFPTQAVYGSTGAPELRLITCGGEFDYETRSYKSNTIAFATLAPPPPAPPVTSPPTVTGAPS